MKKRVILGNSKPQKAESEKNEAIRELAEEREKIFNHIHPSRARVLIR